MPLDGLDSLEKVFEKPKKTDIVTTIPVKKKPVLSPFKEAIVYGTDRVLHIPWRIHADHLYMSSIANGEYNTIMEIKDLGDGEYEVTDWYMPFQEASGGSVDMTKEGAVEFAKTQLYRFERMYGVFHIHPWSSGTSKPSMSGIDVDCMWKWVSGASRGIFVLSGKSGETVAWFVMKANELKIQIPMKVVIGESIESARQVELSNLMNDRITEHTYQKYDYGYTRPETYKADGITPFIPDITGVKEEDILNWVDQRKISTQEINKLKTDGVFQEVWDLIAMRVSRTYFIHGKHNSKYSNKNANQYMRDLGYTEESLKTLNRLWLDYLAQSYYKYQLSLDTEYLALAYMDLLDSKDDKNVKWWDDYDERGN